MLLDFISRLMFTGSKKLQLTSYHCKDGGEDVVDAGGQRGVMQITSLGKKPGKRAAGPTVFKPTT